MNLNPEIPLEKPRALSNKEKINREVESIHNYMTSRIIRDEGLNDIISSVCDTFHVDDIPLIDAFEFDYEEEIINFSEKRLWKSRAEKEGMTEDYFFNHYSGTYMYDKEEDIFDVIDVLVKIFDGAFEVERKY